MSESIGDPGMHHAIVKSAWVVKVTVSLRPPWPWVSPGRTTLDGEAELERLQTAAVVLVILFTWASNVQHQSREWIEGLNIPQISNNYKIRALGAMNHRLKKKRRMFPRTTREHHLDNIREI